MGLINLSSCYKNGEGVSEILEEGSGNIEKVEENGNSLAYLKGKGLKKSEKKELELMQRFFHTGWSVILRKRSLRNEETYFLIVEMK